jgi:F-type H+-transporting ATPase subunit a
MGELGRIHQLLFSIGDYRLAVNLEVVVMTWIVIALLLVFGLATSRRRSLLPRPMQVLGEIVVTQLYNLTEDALGAELGRKYAPLVSALFLFLLASNWLGIIPHLEEPSKDLNTPLALGLMGFGIAHWAGIRSKGFKAYIMEYFQPIFFMMPLNLIGEFAKIVSISFRLFGNIMGGSIIILVVSYLCWNILLPPLLYAFFGLFVGTIQAFVFTMLTVVYIAVQVK